MNSAPDLTTKHTQNELLIANALTIDVEDWFHGLALPHRAWNQLSPRLAVGLTRVLDLLDKHDVKATFFILGAVVEEWRLLLTQVVEAGHEIGLHGFDHTPLYRLTPAKFANDLRRTHAVVRQITDQPILGYRAPYFSITPRTMWALRILAEMGIQYDASVVPTYNPRYGIPNAPRFPHWVDTGARQSAQRIMEYPISTLRIGTFNLPFSGGFYARLLPYPLIRRAMRMTNAQGQPVIFYLHPWELDPDHPHLATAIPPLYRFTHYHNLAGMAEKLDRLLGEFRFVPLSALPVPSWALTLETSRLQTARLAA